jgi:hypothetical protein
MRMNMHQPPSEPPEENVLEREPAATPEERKPEVTREKDKPSDGPEARPKSYLILDPPPPEGR